MMRASRCRRTLASVVAAGAVCVGVLSLSPVVRGQEQFALYVFAVDEKGMPVLDLAASELVIREDAGESVVVSVRRTGWPLKVTVLVDNGARTADALVHYRTGLKKFFDGLPREVPVSLIATAPNPRWLFRPTTDRIQIDKGVNLVTPDDSFARFSDALSEYGRRLDEEFRGLTPEQLPPYLPVLVSIATAHQDGSQVLRETNLKMLTSLRRYRVWANMIMVTPNRPVGEPGVPFVEFDEGQNAAIAKLVQEVTGGRYVPITGSGTSALASKILPDLAQEISARYLRQMTMHRVVLERPDGAIGPMKNFVLALRNRPGVKVVVSTTGSMP